MPKTKICIWGSTSKWIGSKSGEEIIDRITLINVARSLFNSVSPIKLVAVKVLICAGLRDSVTTVFFLISHCEFYLFDFHSFFILLMFYYPRMQYGLLHLCTFSSATDNNIWIYAGEWIWRSRRSKGERISFYMKDYKLNGFSRTLVLCSYRV